MHDDTPAYGLWFRMIFNSFALKLFEPQTKRELRVSDRIRPCV